MKAIPVPSRSLLPFFAPLCLALFPGTAFADGPPVDRETREVYVPHTLVDLDASQAEELETMNTVTFSPEQWASLRKESASCPKRLEVIIPWNLEDCTCGMSLETYGIALSPARLAVIHSSWSREHLAWVMSEGKLAELHIDREGALYLKGAPLPYALLLEAIAETTRQRDSESLRSRIDGAREKPFFAIRIPLGLDHEAPALKERIDEVYRAAEAAGWETMNRYDSE